jgi:hypothetical protein
MPHVITVGSLGSVPNHWGKYDLLEGDMLRLGDAGGWTLFIGII